MDLDRPDRTSHPFSKEPIILAHVCSDWRHIILSQASLWSHIDMFPDRIGDPILSERLEAYAARSAQTLLDVHIVIPYSETINDGPYDIISPFLRAIAPRIQSLTIQSACGIEAGVLCIEVLSICFANCIPGTLSEVSIETVFAEGWDPVMCAEITGVSMNSTESTIEDLWLPVTRLRLTEFLVNWDSKAYHGLTELRLTSLDRPNQSEFLSILLSSPQLRVLEIDGLDEDSLNEDFPLTSVHLNDLEILAMTKVRDVHLRNILQLITPGPKPLTLSIMSPYQDDSEFVSKEALQSFVSRSNITRLCASKFNGYPELAEVLSLIPTLRVLAVDQFNCDTIDREELPPAAQKLDALYVINSTQSWFTWPNVESFVKHYDVRKLTLWKYDFTYSEFVEGSEDPIPDNFHAVCPVARLVSKTEPNPIEEWY